MREEHSRIHSLLNEHYERGTEVVSRVNQSACSLCHEIRQRKRVIRCQICGRVFHLSCVRLTLRQADAIPPWNCTEYIFDRKGGNDAHIVSRTTSVNMQRFVASMPRNNLRTESDDLSTLMKVWLSPIEAIARLPPRIRTRTALLFPNVIKDALTTNSVVSPTQKRSSTHGTASHIASQLDVYMHSCVNALACELPSMERSKNTKSFKGGNGVLKAITIARLGNSIKAVQRLTSTGLCEISEPVRDILSELHPIRPGQHESARQSRSLDVLISHVATDTIQVKSRYLDNDIVGGSPLAIAKAFYKLQCTFQNLNLRMNWAKTEVIGDLSAIHCCLEACDGKPNNNSASNFQILESPIGSDTFITEYLYQQVFPKSKVSIDAVDALPDPQVAYLLLRHCVSGPRITHLMRTIPPHVVTGFLQRFDIEVVHAFETVTAVQLNRHAQQQLVLPLNLGGFRLSNTGLHIPFAWERTAGSVAWEQIAGLWPQELQHMVMVSQPRLSSMIDKEARRHLVEQFNQFGRARLLEVSNQHASAWLQVSPNRNQRFDVPRPHFCVLVRLWLGLPIHIPG
ncbi:hypothetical protein GJ496_003806 [Pomphorhynchus laevis]|nr:hypothetical protein GJ496_003806 [Pomphorhynchus laevis]